MLAEARKAIGEIAAGDICVFSGSVPSGLSESAVVSFLSELKTAGASLVIDSKSLSLDSLSALRPLLIKPNEEEAEKTLGVSIDSIAAAANAAKALREKGIENVLLSLGGDAADLALLLAEDD